MVDITVKKLAGTVDVPVDRLLHQMKDAGLNHEAADDKVSDDEKQILLAHLKKSHGANDQAPRKITLKRKVTTQLKSAKTQGRSSKTVNVEVRKKRTYVKRSTLDSENDSVQAENLAAEEERLANEVAAQKIAEEERLASEAAAQKTAEEEAANDKANKDAQAKAELEATKKQADEQALASKQADANITSELKAPVAAEVSNEEKLKLAKEERELEAKKIHDRKAKKEAKLKSGKRWVEETVNELGGETLAVSKPVRRKHNQSKITKPTRFLKKHAFAKPAAPITKEVLIPDNISVSELALRMSVKANKLIKKLMKMGVMATINQQIDQDTAILLVQDMGHKYSIENVLTKEEMILSEIKNDGEAQLRAPVVTVMGHVDHGKTSLLDYIRDTKVTAGESGGITQHIGAYHVETTKGMICFLDTPGHAAFTAMRARGAQATDIVILVVAADDGVMPQTEEAIKHAHSAGVPIIVAVNKVDKEGADVDRVKNELAAKNVIPEDWGGDVQFISVSAHTGQGIDDLLDAVLLQAEILELKASPDGPAQGIVIEARLDKGRGTVATLLVQNGTLKQGDAVLAGEVYGRVRAMFDENGTSIKTAGPSIPVEVLGLTSTPHAGDDFLILDDDKKAREIATTRAAKNKADMQAKRQVVQLENLFASMTAGEVKPLNIVLKTDVRGSLEALTSTLGSLGNDEVKVTLVTSGVGGISETDANLAVSTGAVIIGFNVRADSSARKIIEKHGLDLRYYSVIYDIVDDVKKALSGMLAPEYKENILGVAEVRDIFTSPKFGYIAGSMVIEGTIHRSKPIRVLRDDIVIYEGELESLRRFKDNATEVRNGLECGIGVKNYTDVRVGDKIEVFDMVEVKRTL